MNSILIYLFSFTSLTSRHLRFFFSKSLFFFFYLSFLAEGKIREIRRRRREGRVEREKEIKKWKTRDERNESEEGVGVGGR